MDRFGLRDWLYRIAAELHDGPDAHLEEKVKAFADETGKPDEPPAVEEPAVPVNPNPTPVSGIDLPLVTEPTPVTSAFTPEQIAELKKALGIG